MVTKAEQKKREEEGNQFIQQREATASKLGLQGKRGIETAASIVSGAEQGGSPAVNAQRTVEEVRQNQARTSQAFSRVGQLPLGQTPVNSRQPIQQSSDPLVNALDTAAGAFTNPITALTEGVGAAREEFLGQSKQERITGAIQTTGAGALALAAAPLVSSVFGTATAGSVAGKSLLGLVSLGSVVGFVSSNRRQKVKEAGANALASKQNLNQIINDINAGIITDPDQAVEAWNLELANIARSERTLKMLTNGVVGDELSGGRDELAKIEGFYRDLPRRNQRLLIALQQPNANAPLQQEPITPQ